MKSIFSAKLKYFLELMIKIQYYMFSFIQLQADTIANAA
jgi:hypothetical protein